MYIIIIIIITTAASKCGVRVRGSKRKAYACICAHKQRSAFRPAVVVGRPNRTGVAIRGNFNFPLRVHVAMVLVAFRCRAPGGPTTKSTAHGCARAAVAGTYTHTRARAHGLRNTAFTVRGQGGRGETRQFPRKRPPA